MRSLRYLTQGVPSAFADCVDYRQTHSLKEVRLDLKTENEIGQSIIILRLEGEFTWIFEDRTVVYSEIMGGIVEGEDEVRQERSLHNANRRLFRRIKDFENLGIDVTNSDVQFHYGELVTGRGEPEASRIEKISKAMREFYRTFPRYRFGKRKLVTILLGLAVFFVVFSMPEWHPAVDPAGQSIPLTREGKGAIALFVLALVWWVFEAAPLGVTTVAIGIFQVLFSIRPGGEAFRDFMDPSVLFIFGSVILGLALTKTGLARRLAYWMLRLVGERTSMILLGGFILTAALSHIMAHTAAAATVFPLLVIINEFYSGKDEKPTRFGKALFIGMAYAAGAGSIVTFLGSARGAAAASLYSDFTGREITFFELSKYMFPVGWLMVLIIWVAMIIFFRPEKRTISGLRLKVQGLAREMGPLAKYEKIVIAVLAGFI
ncbi:MAG TPA: SLC13 family permease, partial [Spirochaetia bacterium]|nr:SLC13 family permease [Spirochaetia bacterium]